MGVIADTILKQSFGFHTGVLVIPDDDMFEDNEPTICPASTNLFVRPISSFKAVASFERSHT